MTMQTYSKEAVDQLVDSLDRATLDCTLLKAENSRLQIQCNNCESNSRRRIMELETLCDPAGIVMENALLKDQTRQLDAFILNKKTRIEVLELILRKLLSVEGDHMTACDRTMGATHPCTCGANRARQLLNNYKGGM